MPISKLEKGHLLYPPVLLNITDPPKALFAQGNLTLLQELHALAVVGTRKCTAYGLAATSKLIKEAAGHEIVIVSGLARGIDAAAHIAALETHGKTIAVLAGGLNTVYPREHKKLAYQILENEGLLLSENEPDVQPRDWMFVKRNRIIAGLCQATLIIEAPAGSGALITANYALDYNRELLCLPGPITSPQSLGTNKLIAEGARIITSSQDLLEVFGINVTETKEPNLFSSTQNKIIQLLNQSSLSLTQIAEQAGLPIEQTAEVITELELTEKICWNSDDTYGAK